MTTHRTPPISPDAPASAPYSRPWMPVFVFAAALVLLAVTGPHRSALAAGVPLYTVAFLALLHLWRRNPSFLASVPVLLGGALLLRLLFLPTLPDLSDDLYRYVWDGRLTALGVNPFRYLPLDPALAPLTDPFLLERLNSPEYFSIYPPLSQWVFLAGGATHLEWGWPASAYAVKLGFTLLELGGVGLLLLAMRRLALPLHHLALYAWNPLVLVALAGGGHSEGGLVFGLGLMAYGAARGSAWRSWLGWIFAVLSKVLPVLLFPLLLRHFAHRFGTRRALLGLLPAVVVGGLLSAPFLFTELPNRLGASAGLYVSLFEFNAGLYFVLKEAALLVTGVDHGKLIGPILMGAFLLLAAIVWLRAEVRRPEALVASCLLVFSLYLALTTTLHPWYLVWGLALVPLTPFLRSAWMWASWAAFPTYLTYVGLPNGLLAGVLWGGVAVFVLRERGIAARALDPLLRLAGRRKARQIVPHLEGTSVLDLGCGEGYVGAAIARGGRTVWGAEVQRFPSPAIPTVRYDGERLPFPTTSIDTVVLSLVLHHSADPDRVLAEALRVARHRVVVTESVYRYAWERRLLEWVDRAVNRARGEGGMGSSADPEPLRFRRAEEWVASIEEIGGRVRLSRRLNRFGHRHHLLVASPISSRSAG